MDVAPPPIDANEIDPKQELLTDVERVRAERDDLERQIAADREKLSSIRVALDAMVHATWRDIFGQQQNMRDRENITSALTLGWVGGYQLVAGAAFALFVVAMVYAFQVTGGVIVGAVYVVLALVGYFVARDQCLAPIKKTRANYLGEDGKDIRFVAFTRYEPSLNHPLIGYDGPTNGVLEDRAWKIPGVREKEALSETFVEVIDERRGNVLLTRFPDKKPTLVHADLENPFVRAYGVFFQRALERHMDSVATQADDFREIVAHSGARKSVDAQLKKLEAELTEFDGTAALMKQMNVPLTIRKRLLRAVVLFRLGSPSVRRGLFLVTGDNVDTMEVMQTLSRASAATLLHLSFSQIKIGYVGQGASTVARIFDTAKRSRSIVFIDEAERFFSLSGSSAYEAMRKEVVQAILSEWDALGDRTDVWLVAAARSREGLDDAVVARFGSLVDFTPSSFADAQMTTVVDTSEVPPEDVEPVTLPEPVVARARLLSAMFAHVDTMESQGITVPRAVLIAGPSQAAKRAVIESLREQTGLPIFGALVEDLDDALSSARDAGRALVAIDVPEYAGAGAVAHLAIAADQLTSSKAPIFILATTNNAETLDPELRARFTELIDLAELDATKRRSLLLGLLSTKPLAFDLVESLDQLEAQTEGMTLEQLRSFVDEAGRKAAMRAIDAGTPDAVRVALDDFERRSGTREPESPDATKDDEAAL
ncbi:MAG TPA: ATP-binding protein [Candidatus Baltobacteraceae bacterium]|nr:ATP-binding protein [Candidatus Baltobacteraceae bacterium]